MAGNKKIFLSTYSQNLRGRRCLTRTWGVGGAENMFFSGKCILVKIPQQNPHLKHSQAKIFSHDPKIFRLKCCYVMETVFLPTHSLILFYRLSSQQHSRQGHEAYELQLQWDTIISSQLSISYFCQTPCDAIKVEKFLLPGYTFKTHCKWKAISLRACIWQLFESPNSYQMLCF